MLASAIPDGIAGGDTIRLTGKEFLSITKPSFINFISENRA